MERDGIAEEIGGQGYLDLVREAKLVRAFNHQGGGLRVAERYDAARGERLVDVLALSTSEIGGRVPTSIVNSATAGAMCAVFSGLARSLQERFPESDCRLLV